jgi:hypothetical protein
VVVAAASRIGLLALTTVVAPARQSFIPRGGHRPGQHERSAVVMVRTEVRLLRATNSVGRPANLPNGDAVVGDVLLVVTRRPD